jgi:hypothetical protein
MAGESSLSRERFYESGSCVQKICASLGVHPNSWVQLGSKHCHPNFALPSMVLAGIPGKSTTQTGLGALTYTTSPPTGLLGVGLGGDSTPRMTAFQLRLEF